MLVKNIRRRIKSNEQENANERHQKSNTVKSAERLVYASNRKSAQSYQGQLYRITCSVISKRCLRHKQSGLKLASLDGLNDSRIYESLFPVKTDAEKKHQKPLPDFSKIHTELKRRYMTRQLLWEEYRQAYPDGYGYTQFCQLYKNWSKSLTISMRQIHKAGEKMFVDYSGLKWKVTDPKTGIVEEVDIFVGVLGASGYTYAEANRDQTKQSFINSHNHAFKYFGGVTEIIIPDNLKSAVSKASRYDPDLNETFQDMAEHYGTVILPARPYRPKDKGKVELSVKLVQRWILARLRHQTFFSIEELNEAIWFLLDDLNNRKMKKLEKSRKQLFEELDSPALKPLPVYSYELRE
ncbi:MAG: IS21 family transposase, partial [Candidatus Marinimicrobia bacterium]|nr:IS21 family transposase [Candidatus Neomarinimicrobiota bacterium]